MLMIGFCHGQISWCWVDEKYNFDNVVFELSGTVHSPV
jgi:hypothetical protein